MAHTDAQPETKNQVQDPAAPANCAAVDDFDPEGWMQENPTYWLDLPDAEPPTRSAWLRHRAKEFATWLHLAKSKAEPKVSEEEWIALSESVLGPLPRPAPQERKSARPAMPDARKPARKPAAYSPSTPQGATSNCGQMGTQT